MTGDLFTSRYVNVHTDDYAQALTGQLAALGLATFDGVHDHAILLTLPAAPASRSCTATPTQPA